MIAVYLILIIIAIPLVAAALMKDEYTIQEEIVINKPSTVVFDFVRFLKNTDQYNKWAMLDPNVNRTFTGTDGTVGCIYAWDSTHKQVGKGEQEITKITEGSRIDYKLRFFKPFEGEADSWLITSPVNNNETKVSWGFYGKRNFANRIFHFLFNMKKMLGKDLQTSLQNLKGILENA
ncbi:MAG: SRPBCC family protein [Bacteroidota bacterium]